MLKDVGSSDSIAGPSVITLSVRTNGSTGILPVHYPNRLEAEWH